MRACRDRRAARMELPGAVRAEVEKFLGPAEEPSRSYMRNLGLGALTFDGIRRRIREVYENRAPIRKKGAHLHRRFCASGLLPARLRPREKPMSRQGVRAE